MGCISQYEKHLPYFNERYDFGICPSGRVNDLVEFIDTYWKKDHIFARSPEFLSWNHYDKTNDCYNFIIAVQKSTGKIQAMEGFTLSSHFDPDIQKPVAWGSMWKNRLEAEEPGLGLMVHWKLYETYGKYGSCGIGMSKKAVRISNAIVANVAVLAKQYFILHPVKTEFKIAANTASGARYSAKAVKSNKKLLNCSQDDFNALDGVVIKTIPQHKSLKYYINRYFNHPIYKYQASMVRDNNSGITAVIFWRFCYYESAKCIRIVDYFGEEDALAGCLDGFLDLLVEHDSEYIDFICKGMPPEIMEAAGFADRGKQDGIVIPNYFEPFVQSNIDVYCSVYPTDIRVFKGDSDQDRPS